VNGIGILPVEPHHGQDGRATDELIENSKCPN
jgi:hypothetical protein